MTDYEALELRHYYRLEVASAFRYWVSVTFAVLVAAYVAGDQLNIWTVCLILVLYVMVSYSNNRVMRTIGKDLRAMGEQIMAMAEEARGKSPTLNAAADDSRGGASFLAVALTMRASLFIGTIVFVLYQAGYVG